MEDKQTWDNNLVLLMEDIEPHLLLMTTTVNHIHYPDHDTYFFDDMLWEGTGCVDN